MRSFMGVQTLAVTVALAAAGTALGQGQVNGAGATLFVDFFRVEQSFNDFLDVDGDGVTEIFPFRDNLANSTPGTWVSPLGAGDNQAWWIFQYRSVGSVAGFQEWVDYQTCGFLPVSVPSERGLINAQDFAITGVPVSPLPGGLAPCTDPLDTVDADGVPNASGTPICPQTIDFANADVESGWAIQGPAGAPGPFATPATGGYGQNPNPSRGVGAQAGFPSVLATLGGDCDRDPNTPAVTLNFNFGSPDAFTVYDTPIAFSPVAPIANRGTGVDLLTYTDMQHLWLTGRDKQGENYAVASRDVGSGTRNAFSNSLGIDPSWLVGDHVGQRVDSSSDTDLGPAHQVSNCGGSSVMENSVQNRRNAIGYTGLLGSSRAIIDARNALYEIVDVIKDVDVDGPGPQKAATGRVRPSRTSLILNGDPNTGFQIAGIQSLATVGNPNANRDPNDPLYNPSDPPMDNQNAADFINNIVSSLVEFQDPNDPNADTFRTPGQVLAETFVLTSAADKLGLSADPDNFQPNPFFNGALQTSLLNQPFDDTEPYGSTSVAGVCPDRMVNPGLYSDGSDRNYVYNDGAVRTIANGALLSAANALAADFNQDGVRDCADAAAFMAALDDPDTVRATALPGDTADMTVNVIIPEVIGDLNGDGNFDLEDARYFADGHAMADTDNDGNTPNALCRTCGFEGVDNGWDALGNGNNPFGTTLATGVAYKPGDSKADVAGGSVDPTPGASPMAHDGVVDAADIEYVFANFGDWAKVADALTMDLSCDMNCDLVVDIDDVREIVETVLETTSGDADLDGDVDLDDLLIVLNNFGSAAGWSSGDFDGTGVVGLDDLLIVLSNFGFGAP